MEINGVIPESTAGIIKAEKMFGSEQALAKKTGVSRQRLSYWKTVTLIPYEMAVRIFVVTDGKVSIDELRPDLKILTREMKSIFLKQMLQKIFQVLQSSCNLFL